MNGEGWRPVREVTQLTENIGSTFRLEPDHLLYSGDFGPRNSVDVVARLCRGPQERRLVITRDLHRKEIYFRKGKVVHITSNRKRELFGSVLVQKGVITQDQLDRAVSEIQANGGPLYRLSTVGLEQADLFGFWKYNSGKSLYLYFPGKMPVTKCTEIHIRHTELRRL